METLVVMSLLAIIGGFTAFMTIDSFRGFSFRGDRDALVSLLQRARSQSTSNICLGVGCTKGRPHGVAIVSGNYVIFQGDSYLSRDMAVDMTLSPAYTSTIGGTISEVVFKQLSGDVVTPGDITISDMTGRISTISINAEGRISWTN